jgi:hypothetical protein
MTSPRLKILERKLGLVPKQYAPMSQGMERIARQSEKAPAPAPVTGDLGAAIEQAIQSTVDQRVEEALVEQRQQLVRQPPMPTQLPPVKKPMPPILSTVTRRDNFGRILWMDSTAEGTDLTWRSEVLSRDENGSIRSLRTSLLPDQALPVPYLPSARQYRPPEPR